MVADEEISGYGRGFNGRVNLHADVLDRMSVVQMMVVVEQTYVQIYMHVLVNWM